MYSRQRGSITVFVCLLLVTVLTLVGTVAEVARLQVAKTYAERGQQLAMEAEFTKYHQELYEDYKLFLREQKQDITTMDNNEFTESIQDYLLYSFQPQKDLQVFGVKIPTQNIDMLNLSTVECKVVDKKHITDEDGGLLENQITELMKYDVTSNVLEKFLGNAKETGKTETTLNVINEKLEVEEKVADINEKIIDLMEIVEGITFDDGKLEIENHDSIKIQPYFAKKFCTVAASPSNVGINHNTVYDSLCTKYVNPKSVIKEVVDSLKKYQSFIDEIEKYSKKIEENQKEIEKEQEKDAPDEERIAELEEANTKLQEKLDKAKEKLQKQFTIGKRVELNGKINSLIRMAVKIKEKDKKALTLISELKQKKAEVAPQVAQFQNTLNTNKSKINKDVYTGIEEDYKELKKYVDNINDETGIDESVVGNIVQMKKQLEKNKSILEKVCEFSNNPIKSDLEQLGAEIDNLNELSKQFQSYSIKELKFDYSDLKVDLESQDGSIFSTFGDLIEDGLLGLVVDNPDKISKAKIKTASLPSEKHPSSGGASFGDDTDHLQDTIVNEDKENLSESIKPEDSGESMVEVLSGGEKLINKAFIAEYIKSYFKKYGPAQDKKETSSGEVKKTALKYEQEYIVNGADNDYDNMKSIVRKTVFYRVIFNYLYLLSNSTAREKAAVTATAMVGFTGFAPLISLTKHLILITWAFEEALVDVRMLLDGKTVPIFKKESSFQVKYSELLSMTKEKIKAKAKHASEKKTSGYMDWGDYMQIYILTMDKEEILYRIMDLIQLNIQIRYSKDFQLDQCLYAIKTKVKYQMPVKLLNIPFIRKEADYTGEGCEFEIEKECTY
ncbi:hypothetical protein lbkm_3261 [Lachnospiraceae bacterium KM106-2]|nr:hypothetical protein lbkm_3261 [Lachnospiraceae bacterium KM106-2]